MNLLARLTRAAAALTVTVGLSVGVPWGLLNGIGSPIPKRWPSLHTVAGWMSTRFDIHVFIGLAVYVLWACWAVFVAQLLVQLPGIVADVVAIARHREPTGRRAAGPGGALAQGLVAAFTIALLAPRGVSTAAAAAKASGYIVSPSARTTVTAPAVPGARGETGHVHVVKVGETLWGIAEQHLGDPERWHDLFRLNAGVSQPDGRALTDPQLIVPGWQLRLPGASGTVAAGLATPGSGTATSPDLSRAATTPSVVVRAPQHDPATPSMPLPTPTPAPATTMPRARPASDAHEAPSARVTPRDRAAVHLPGGGLVPITLASGVAAALALARLRTRARTRIRSTGDEYQPEPPALAPASSTLLRAHQATLCAPGRGLFQDADDFGDDPYANDEPTSNIDRSDPEASDKPWSLVAGPGDPTAATTFAPSLHTVLEPTEAPDEIHVAVRDNTPILLSEVTDSGLGLTGDGALDTARSLFVCALAAGGPRLLDQAAEIHTTAQVLDGLLGPGVTLPDTTRLTVFDSLTKLLDNAVHEQDARTAEIAEYGHASAADVHRFENLHPFHPRILLVPLDVSERHQLDSLARRGASTDMHLVLLGAWPAGTTATIGADRIITGSGRHAAALHEATAFGITAEEAAQILETLNAASDPHTSEEPFTDTAEDDGQPAPPHHANAQDDTDEDASTPAAHLTVVPTVHRPQPNDGVLQLNLMGPFTAEVDGHDVTAAFQPAHRTLLLYLALRRRPVPRSEITDTLWVDDDLGDQKAKAKSLLSFRTVWMTGHALGWFRRDRCMRTGPSV